MTITWHAFTSGDDLARGLAARVAAAAAARLATDGAAAIALSGGRTPARFVAALAATALDWARVTVTLVDERWVDETSERSNARLVRGALAAGPAAAARFLPLYDGGSAPEAGLAPDWLASLPLPFAAVVLGMGDDGHTASFFPHAEGLTEALAPKDGALLAAVRAEAAVEPRITLTLPPILAADFRALHIEGAGKRAVYEAALAGDDVLEMPVRAVLGSSRPVEVFWTAG